MIPSLPPRRGAARKAPRGIVLALAVLATALAAAPAETAVRADEEAFHYREMSRLDIEEELIGRAVDGHYASGVPFSEAFNADLTSDYSDENGEARGVMSFRGDTFCFAYPDDGTMSGGCFVVWQRSDNCYDFYAALNGQAYAGFLARSLGVDWDARVWRKDAPSTCPVMPIS